MVFEVPKGSVERIVVGHLGRGGGSSRRLWEMVRGDNRVMDLGRLATGRGEAGADAGIRMEPGVEASEVGR